MTQWKLGELFVDGDDGDPYLSICTHPGYEVARIRDDVPDRRRVATVLAAAPDGYALAEECANHLYTKQDIDRVREMAKKFLAKVDTQPS